MKDFKPAKAKIYIEPEISWGGRHDTKNKT